MKKSFFIKIYGCQANKADSERIAGFLEKKGYKEAISIKEADLVVINSCSVRQTAEDRIGGLVRNLSKLKTHPKPEQSSVQGSPDTDFQSGSGQNSKLKIILTGCTLYHGIPWLKERFKNIDEFVPTQKLIDPQIPPKRKEQPPPSHKASAFGSTKLGLRPTQSAGKHAWVPIMEGCSHFCTYCVVPYARGKEVSRSLEEIVCEVEELARRGYKEITLLGQNVNSYGKDFKNSKLKTHPKPEQSSVQGSPDTDFQSGSGQNSKLQLKSKNLKKIKTPFALLLAVLHQIPGIEKISFITSNPWDLTDEIIEAMSLPKIDRCLHLAVQSGDNEILRRMNRPYTAQDYIKLTKKIRNKIPDIKMGTDIIVGFPGETKKQFQNTVNLCKKVGFEKAYIAMYSPRPGTAAYKFKDNVPCEEKKRRWKILDDLINKKVFS